MTTTIEIPSNALVMTLGPAGSGKSTFLKTHFPPGSIVSTDVCREMVSDDATNQSCNKVAFDLFHQWIGARLKMGRLTVADATNLRQKSRKQLLSIAEAARVPVVLLVVDALLDTCLRQNAQRDRFVPEDVIRTHYAQAVEAMGQIDAEGYSEIHIVRPGETYRMNIRGGYHEVAGTGFDIIGDVHGCAQELETLIAKLGYTLDWIHGPDHEGLGYVHLAQPGRKMVFVGDFCDRGPYNDTVLRLVHLALGSGHLAVRGNHDDKLRRALKGNKVQRTHGLDGTMQQIEKLPAAEQQTFLTMLEALPYQLRLSVENVPDVYVVHGGIPREMAGLDTSHARQHALYGENIGTDKEVIRGFGYVKGWAPGDNEPVLVHGHTVTAWPFSHLFNNVVNVDQGCVFGGKLTALRWPEYEVQQVPALRVYDDSKFEYTK